MAGKKFFPVIHAFSLKLKSILTCLLCLLSFEILAQDVVSNDTLSDVTDVSDLLKKLFNKKSDSTKPKKQGGIAILPSLGYNPSFGFVIGAKASAIKQFGSKETTNLSAFGLEFQYTSKGIITAQARHSVFTKDNKWNLLGNWQLSKFLIMDYNLGTGNKDYETDSDSAFLIRFNFIRLTERAFRKVGKNFYVGAGVSLNIRDKIDDKQLDSLKSTPHSRYSIRNDFNLTKYSANALLLGVEYNTREHPLRSYGGLYADLNLAVSQKWLGSTKTALQIVYDIRKYVSLSKKNPEHVVAFWHLASYTIDGKVPYLALQGTGYDLYNRSGRGYTIGRFKGPQYAYFETEYRFPLTRNKLISGVAFVNFQTASDDLGKKLFQYIDPAAGGGLRILFQKQSRSVVCIDYAKGKYGSGGFFFGLNEVF
jgi:hypothetical protein